MVFINNGVQSGTKKDPGKTNERCAQLFMAEFVKDNTVCKESKPLRVRSHHCATLLSYRRGTPIVAKIFDFGWCWLRHRLKLTLLHETFLTADVNWHCFLCLQLKKRLNSFGSGNAKQLIMESSCDVYLMVEVAMRLQSRGGRSPHDRKLPTNPRKKPNQPTVTGTPPVQLITTSTVPIAHKYQAI